jgi:hypothetical protein
MPLHASLRFASIGLLLGLALPVRAQLTASLGPIVGYYRPFGHFDPASVYTTALPTTPADLQGLALGAAGQLAIGERFGVRTQGAVAWSTIPEVITPDGPRGPTAARVEFATVEGLYDASRSPSRYRLWLGIGPAVVRHTGDAYAPYSSPVSTGGTASLELVVPLASGFQLAADATTLWYTFDLGTPRDVGLNAGIREHGAQRDALVHIGLRWSWRRPPLPNKR